MLSYLETLVLDGTPGPFNKDIVVGSTSVIHTDSGSCVEKEVHILRRYEDMDITLRHLVQNLCYSIPSSSIITCFASRQYAPVIGTLLYTSIHRFRYLLSSIACVMRFGYLRQNWIITVLCKAHFVRYVANVVFFQSREHQKYTIITWRWRGA